MAQITKQQARKWANALRSGKFKQSRGTLEDRNGFCCLGVACKVFIPKSSQVIDSDGHLFGIEPKAQAKAPKWLKQISRDLLEKLGQSFISLNDIERYSFDEIADLIELVYVHRALG